MKAVFILFVLLSDTSGNEQLLAVSEKKHESLLSCYVEKAKYQDIQGHIKFFCENESKFLKVEK